MYYQLSSLLLFAISYQVYLNIYHTLSTLVEYLLSFIQYIRIFTTFRRILKRISVKKFCCKDVLLNFYRNWSILCNFVLIGDNAVSTGLTDELRYALFSSVYIFK